MKPSELPKNSNDELFGKPFTSSLSVRAVSELHKGYLVLTDVSTWGNISHDNRKQDIHFISLICHGLTVELISLQS